MADCGFVQAELNPAKKESKAVHLTLSLVTRLEVQESEALVDDKFFAKTIYPDENQ